MPRQKPIIIRSRYPSIEETRKRLGMSKKRLAFLQGLFAAIEFHERKIKRKKEYLKGFEKGLKVLKKNPKLLPTALAR